MIWKTTSAGKTISAIYARLLSSAEIRRQLSRFLVIGTGCVLVDLTIYQLLATQLSLPLYVAKGISYLAGVVVGFVGNKWWTFRSTRRSAAEPLSYLALYLVTLAVNIGCNQAILMALGGLIVANQAKWVAFLIATGMTTVLNFIGMRLFTFRQGIAERGTISSHGQAFDRPMPARIDGQNSDGADRLAKAA
ncbi:MAG TPA: GtrA family protein [Pirellulales bacterium]